MLAACAQLPNGVLRDLTGRTFGRLTVIGRAPNRGKATCWKCRCVCGSTSVAEADPLVDGRTRSCGCVRRENSRRLGVENPPISFRYDDPFIPAINHILHVYICAARKRRLEWALTRDEVIRLVTANCHYCGTHPATSTRKRGIFYNGIDRVDNERGYITENVVTACEFCNKAKSVKSYASFIAWLDGLVAFRTKGRNEA